ncbi:hypothetical protein D3C78_1922410 [compost metagenome]
MQVLAEGFRAGQEVEVALLGDGLRVQVKELGQERSDDARDVMAVAAQAFHGRQDAKRLGIGI